MILKVFAIIVSEFLLQEEHGLGNDKMTRKLFHQYLHSHFNMTDRVLMDQIFKYFNEDHDTEITR